nr:putative pectinesterase 29 [Quercus suber]
MMMPLQRKLTLSPAITENTFNHVIRRSLFRNNVTWAPAAFVQGDKVSFHSCDFISLQDTLTDWEGRHYFDKCYFEGAIDFIWGAGQSIYQGNDHICRDRLHWTRGRVADMSKRVKWEKNLSEEEVQQLVSNCVINVTESLLADGNAYVTAQARESDKETNGFVFKYCKVTGSGPAFIGRAYGYYSRVVFYKSVFADIIAPQGWDAWNREGKEEMITYAEIGCTGPGADMSKCVKWEKNLSEEEVRQIVRVRLFINQEMWLQEQLHAPTISSPHMLLEK